MTIITIKQSVIIELHHITVGENNLRSCTSHSRSILISTDLIMKGKLTQWFKKRGFHVREHVK